MWKSVVGAWLNVRPGLTKADPTNSAETLRQPFFGNPSILNASGVPLGLGSLRDGSAFVRHGCSQVKDLWNPEERDWKSLSELGMNYHASNKRCKKAIIASIPWRPDECTRHPSRGVDRHPQSKPSLLPRMGLHCPPIRSRYNRRD
jgi:hypothetical protein